MGSNYSDNLEHMAEPSTPDERHDADPVNIKDWDALYLGEQLREWAAYNAPSEKHKNIALAYSDYIRCQVRERGESFVALYSHTDDARFVLMKVAHDVETVDTTESKQSRRVVNQIENAFPDYGLEENETADSDDSRSESAEAGGAPSDDPEAEPGEA